MGGIDLVVRRQAAHQKEPLGRDEGDNIGAETPGGLSLLSGASVAGVSLPAGYGDPGGTIDSGRSGRGGRIV